MEKISFDSGVKEYQIGSGVLRFNPSDPNVYARFVNSRDAIKEVEQTFTAEAERLQKSGDDSGEAALKLISDLDRQIKGILNSAFGGDNDFDAILGGGSFFATGGNGMMVIENVMAALTPIMEKGAQRCSQEQVNAAVRNRAQRRAQMKVQK